MRRNLQAWLILLGLAGGLLGYEISARACAGCFSDAGCTSSPCGSHCTSDGVVTGNCVTPSPETSSSVFFILCGGIALLVFAKSASLRGSLRQRT